MKMVIFSPRNSPARAGAGAAHQIGPVVEDVEQRADREEQEDDRDLGQHRGVERPAAFAGIAAGEEALGDVLVEPHAGEEQQGDAGDARQQREGVREIERKVDQPELVARRRGWS